MSWATSALVFVAVLSVAASAAADPIDEARALGKQGLEHHREGRWEACIVAMRAAEQRHHAPTHTLYIARCEAGRGKLLEARELYAKVANEELPEDAHPRWVTAVEEATTEQATLAERIPTLFVSVTGASADQVTIDGQPTTTATAIPLDPGLHVVEARASGHITATRTITLAEREEGKVELTLEPIPMPAPVVTPSAPPAPSERAPTPVEPRGTAYWPVGVAAVSVGGAALMSAVVTGVFAITRYNEVRESCDEALSCLAEEQDRAEGGARLADASTALFVVGGAFSVAGIVLLLLPTEHDSGREVALRVDGRGLHCIGTF